MLERPHAVRSLAVLATVLMLTPLAAAQLPGLPGADPLPPASEVGAFTDIIEGEVPAVSMAVLADGRVLYWSGVEATDSGDHSDNLFFLEGPHDADSRVLDLATMGVVTPGNSNGGASDLFCAGHTSLPDGRVMAVGGTDWTSIPASAPTWDVLYGTPDVRVFDVQNTSWEPAPSMVEGRWYPSAIPLADGDVLVASGIETLTNPDTMQERLERYDVEDGDWDDAGDRLLPMYPRLTVVPSGPYEGKVFYSTNGALWGPFGEHPAEAQWSLQQVYDPVSGDWSFLGPSVFGARQHGASVMLPLDPGAGYAARILTFGGTLQRSTVAVPFAEMADLSTTPPTNTPVAPMHEGRWHLNGVLLPDGKVLAVGGARYDNVVVHGQRNAPVMSAELYDPDTDTWTLAPGMQVGRGYHSTALLLPDGRVLIGGHVPLPIPWKDVRDGTEGTALNQSQIQERRLEIYEPPYLHYGVERPTITAAPSAVAYATSFVVAVDDASDIESAMLVRPGMTTHGFDSAQRGILLNVTDNGDGTLTLDAPPDGNVAPPGQYMLFVNRGSTQGAVPSEAVFVSLNEVVALGQGSGGAGLLSGLDRGLTSTTAPDVEHDHAGHVHADEQAVGDAATSFTVPAPGVLLALAAVVGAVVLRRRE